MTSIALGTPAAEAADGRSPQAVEATDVAGPLPTLPVLPELLLPQAMAKAAAAMQTKMTARPRAGAAGNRFCRGGLLRHEPATWWVALRRGCLYRS
ncbi:MAG: hypothetical protein ACYDCQ_10550 [Dehalococcoidia bacterium]